MTIIVILIISLLFKWEDKDFKIPGDESITELQNRNILALKKILKEHKDQNIIIGTHGMALSAIINYYDKTYGYNDFLSMVKMKPWVVKMTFDDDLCTQMEFIDLFAKWARSLQLIACPPIYASDKTNSSAVAGKSGSPGWQVANTAKLPNAFATHSGVPFRDSRTVFIWLKGNIFH